MSAYCCSGCGHNWPPSTRFACCPICGDKTEYGKDVDALAYDEADALVAKHKAWLQAFADFEAFYEQRALTELRAEMDAWAA